MATHHIHHTEAFVLGSSPKGEDSKLFRLYTRELGLVYAHAQGIRKISSKLRFTLQDFSLASVDLVRGKEIWRVTTAVPIRSHTDLLRTPAIEKILARVSSLLIRLVPGEEVNDEVFATLSRTYEFLSVEGKTVEDHRALELLTIARILVSLGYLSRETPGIAPVQGDLGFGNSVVIPKEFEDLQYQHRLIREINQALAATQL